MDSSKAMLRALVTIVTPGSSPGSIRCSVRPRTRDTSLVVVPPFSPITSPKCTMPATASAIAVFATALRGALYCSGSS
jgi:hypothetical protein